MDRASDPVLVFADNPGPLTGRGNNTWLLDGAAPTLIDAGTGVPTHLDALAAALGGRPLARVLVTHGHPDHASGVPALRERWPAIEVCAFAGVRIDPPVRPLADGEELPAGGARLVAVHTPGHAPDHLCFWDARRRWLFGGDLLMLGSTIMIPAGRGGNVRQYLASLDRVAALGPSRVFPGHGPIIDQPAELIAAYIEHRREREEQILRAIDAGAADVDSILPRVYPGLPEALEWPARVTIEAHLEKLREEGRLPAAFPK